MYEWRTAAQAKEIYFILKKGQYLGHLVSAAGISLVTDKVDSRLGEILANSEN